MTGRIVFEPTGEHRCVVWFRYGDNGLGRVDIGNAAEYAQPGTVLECDCRATFVAQPWQPGEMFPRWRRETRIARWLRERRQRRTVGSRHVGGAPHRTLPPPPTRPGPGVPEGAE